MASEIRNQTKKSRKALFCLERDKKQFFLRKLTKKGVGYGGRCVKKQKK